MPKALHTAARGEKTRAPRAFSPPRVIPTFHSSSEKVGWSLGEAQSRTKSYPANLGRDHVPSAPAPAGERFLSLAHGDAFPEVARSSRQVRDGACLSGTALYAVDSAPMITEVYDCYDGLPSQCRLTSNPPVRFRSRQHPSSYASDAIRSDRSGVGCGMAKAD